MYFPWIVSVIFSWEGGEAFFWSATTSSVLCLLVSLASRGDMPRVSARFGIVVVNLLWWTCPLICGLPFMLGDNPLSTVDSIFEAVSGLTTTGSTVIADLDIQQKPVLVWRAIIQWIGGLGILSLGLILLPFLRVGGMQLFRMESSDRAEKPLPRLIEISRTIIMIYLILSAACTILYYVAGMSLFDSVVHAMTTVSTGGFSSHNESLGHFNSLGILWIAIFFMVIGGLPFNFFIGVFFTRNIPNLDPQIFVFFGIIVSSILILCLADFTISGLSFSEFTFRAFNIVAIVTTTGYAAGDFMSYGMVGPTLFFVLIFVGGCAGSTACGIKIFRIQLLYRFLSNQLKKIIYPRGIFIIKYDNNNIDDKFMSSVISFIFLYIIIFFCLTAILSLTGLDFITSISGAATSISNVGPGLGETIGPNGNFSSLSEPSKWALSMGMILGRLELFAILVLFIPSFWRKY